MLQVCTSRVLCLQDLALSVLLDALLNDDTFSCNKHTLFHALINVVSSGACEDD
jgi:hypothetical protein